MPKKDLIKFHLKGNYVELYKILKIEGLANSGGIAKLLVADGLVKVNGKVETRKRRKIVVGDTIEFNFWDIVVVC